MVHVMDTVIPALCRDVCGLLVCMRLSTTWNDSYIVGRSSIFILVSGLSVFWHFNRPDFIAAYK